MTSTPQVFVPDTAWPVTATAPETVGDYVVLRELGRGGMGVVFLGRHRQLDRLAAIKFVRGPLADDLDGLARFRSEAKLLARVRHPNIVQVYEVGEVGGRPYLALEYVAGGTLADELQRRRPPPREAAELLRPIAQGVHAAHVLGVVHRDLKPNNILLADAVPSDPAAGRDWQSAPKVGDFGLAKDIAAPADRGLTQTGTVVGTPDYMAPEQAGGDGPLGPATDIWALGAILYELLTGRPPFAGRDGIDTLLQVRFLDPLPVRSLNPAVPADLETICLKCLHKDPARRYATADALADDLRRFLDGEPVRARPVSDFERFARWCRRRPAVAAMIAVTAAALILLAVGAMYFNLRLQSALAAESAARLRAARHEADARRRLDSALAAHRQLVSEVRSIGDVPATRPAKLRLLQTAVTGLHEIAGSFGNAEPDRHRAEAHWNIGSLYRQLGRTDDAAREFETALEVTRPLTADSAARDIRARCLHALASVALERDDPDRAEALAAEAHQIARELQAEAPGKSELPRMILNFSGRLGHALVWKRQTAKARPILERVYRDARAMWVGQPGNAQAAHQFTTACDQMAALAEAEGDPAAAAEFCRQALPVNRQLVADRPDLPFVRRNLLATLGNLGGYCHQLHGPSAARPYLEEAEQIGRQLVEADPANVQFQGDLVMALIELAKCDDALGRYGDAAGRYREAIGQLRTLRAAGKLSDPSPLVEQLPELEARLWAIADGSGGHF